MFLDALNQEIAASGDKAKAKKVYSIYKKHIDDELKAAKDQKRDVKPFAELISHINSNFIYNLSKVSANFIADVEASITDSLTKVKAAFMHTEPVLGAILGAYKASLSDFDLKQVKDCIIEDLGISSEQTMLKTTAQKVGSALELYGALEKDYPLTAKLLLPVIAVGSKTAIGAVSGAKTGPGGPMQGAMSGFTLGVGAEVTSILADFVVGDKIGQAAAGAAKGISYALKKYDHTLTDEESHTLAVALMLTATTYKSFKGDILDAKTISQNVSKNVKLKPDDFTQAYKFDSGSEVKYKVDMETGQLKLESSDSGPKSWNDLIKGKKYPDTVEKINNRFPINAEYAGKKFPLEKLPEQLQKLYPDSVEFDSKGFPRFEPYAKISVQVEGLTGDRKVDTRLANIAAGITKKPDSFVWHHVEDGKTMLLIPEALHEAVRHTGWVAISKGKK